MYPPLLLKESVPMREKLEKIEMFVGSIDCFFHQKPYRCLVGSFIVGGILTAAVGLHLEHERRANAAAVTPPAGTPIPDELGAPVPRSLDTPPPGPGASRPTASDDETAPDAASFPPPE